MELDLIENLQAKKIKLEQLFLNPNNPRLMDKGRKTELDENRIIESKIQDKIIKDLRFEGINDLYEKIKKLGFLPIDRIVVKKLNTGDENYLVLEGNRRITTAKLLSKEHVEGIITLDGKIIDSLNEIEVLVYTGTDKNIIWLLQGMRHINGIKEWGALQQARFLYEMQNDNSLNATELDKMTGLGRNSISNKIRSYKGYMIAQSIYHGELSESNFSLFQEAIFTRPQIKNWLSWNDITDEFENVENLELLLNWYLGDEEGQKRFDRVLDIRDHFNQLLLPDNKNILIKFINTPDYTINDAIQEINNKVAEKNAQINQMDLQSRLSELNSFYLILSTLPIKNIKDSDEKLNFISVINNIKDTAEFNYNILISENENK